jgi:adenylosuccinate lyase
MLRNIEMTRGLVFSGQLLQDLVEHGVPRETAYKWVQSHAMAAWESETSFRERIITDSEIAKHMTAADLARTFELKRQISAVDAIFARVFGKRA